MDVRPDPASTAFPAPRSPSDRDDLRGLLPALGRELCRPVAALQDAVARIVGDPAATAGPERLEPVRTMIGLCDELLGLTGGYLDYAGLTRGARAPRPSPTTLGAVLGAIDRRFAAAAAARGLAWSCAIDGEDRPLRADAGLCCEAAGHLIENALKFSPTGGPVRVVGRSDGPWWHLVVADEGPGIPEADRARVFEPFARLPRDEHAGIPGHGLGLAACRALVVRLGGQVAIEPGAARGTRVRVSLPAEGRDAGVEG